MGRVTITYNITLKNQSDKSRIIIVKVIISSSPIISTKTKNITASTFEHNNVQLCIAKYKLCNSNTSTYEAIVKRLTFNLRSITLLDK